MRRLENVEKRNKICIIYRKILVCIAELLFPRRCPVCGEIVQEPGSLICRRCIPRLNPVREPVCRKCGKQIFSEQSEYCLDCSRHARSFVTGRALLHYNEAAAKSLSAVKYKNKREYLDFYAQVMAYRFRTQVEHWGPEVLVPVPVHPSRYRKRGFNQAEELAGRLSSLWGIPMQTDLLIRVKRTAAQKNLTPAERLGNLQKAFAVRSHVRVPEAVVLVDDIYTTGSTVEACTRVLMEAGVKRVYFLAICIGYGK